MAAELTAHDLIAKHRPTLDQALEVIRTRAYWSPHPEHPKAYGENGSLDAAAGKAAFDALLGTRLDGQAPPRSRSAARLHRVRPWDARGRACRW
ncbi:hypothetical protein SALBM311S_08010 [Streptomyces alboniger]